MELLLVRNARGKDVAALRKALVTQLGADAQAFAGLARGDLLDATVEAAVRAWQSGVGLVADGVVGPRCQELLGLRSSNAMGVALNLASVRALFPATKPANIERYLPYVCAALAACGLRDRPMITAALATIRAESEGFLPISEFPSQFNSRPGAAPFGAYEGSRKLGNTQEGDGARFKGRGFVQLTGRLNYERFGAALGIDLAADTAHAELANAPEVACLLLARFLADGAVPMRAALAAGNLAAARKLVNGGSHGLPRFKDVFLLAGQHWPALPPVAGRKRVAAKTGAATARRGLSARKDPTDLRDKAYTPLPVSLDAAYPSDSEIAALLPVYSRAGLILDQGQEGACTGFGLACVVNYLRWRKAGTPKKMGSVSPRMLYTFARRHDEYAGEDYDGSSCRGALKGWFHNGVCLEEDWPYADARPRYGYAQRAGQQSLGVYFRIELKSITDLQAAIQQVGAVFVSAFTHAGWNDVPVDTRPPKGHASLPVIAFDGRPSKVDGHAFALMGFNEQGFIVQNSWGRGFGAGGFAVLGYADWLANALDAWVVALGVPGVIVGRVGSGAGAGSGLAGGVGRSLWWSKEQAYQHSVVLGNDGRVSRYLTEDELSRNLLHQVAGQPDKWFRSKGLSGPKRLLIYAHGGLNSEGDAIARARAMGRHFLANGCYPLFLVWKTGLLESIGDILGDAMRKEAPKAAGLGEWLTDKSDLLIEKTIGRPLARPIWSEMKENADLAFGPGRGGDLLITALQKLADTWGTQLEIHIVGHSAGSILLGHMLTGFATRKLGAPVRSAHLYAPACTVAFANRHFAADAALMKCLHLDVLSDRVERNDNVVSIYRKSLLYFVSNALETDLRTPVLGLANVSLQDYSGWDGSSSTGDALRAWRRAAAEAGLAKRTQLLDADKIAVAEAAGQPAQKISAGHGGFDNDIEVVSRTLRRILGGALLAPVDDLRGF